MPKNNVPPLLPLPPDLSWLIHMEPSREALDDYLAPDSVPVHAAKRPLGAHTTRFSTTNVFANPPNASYAIFRYDLIPYDRMTLPFDTSLRKRPVPVGMASITFDEKTFWCKQLLSAWKRDDLDLSPGLSRPSPGLLQALCDDNAADHLMLLTARAELGHFYLTVQEWHQRAERRVMLDLDDEYLGLDAVGVLNARAQGFRYWGLGGTESSPYDSTMRDRRHDAPRDLFVADSDLARLYWQFYIWYRDVYYSVINVPTCRQKGCSRWLPPYGGRGPHAQYCKAHAKERVRASNRRAQGKIRKKKAPPKGRERSKRKN